MGMSPLTEKTNESGVAIASPSEQADTASNFIAVDVNHATKQIIVEVAGTPVTPADTLPSATQFPSSPLLLESNENPIKTQNENSVENSFGLSMSTDEVDKTLDRTYETPINASMTVQLTPITDNRDSFGGTPIGMIRLRQTMNEFPVDTIDESSAYEILMVSTDRISPMKKVRFNTIDSIMGTNQKENENHFHHADETEVASVERYVGKAYPMPVNNAIACKMSANNQYFPIAPQMIINRISSLQEYNRSITMQIIARQAAESMRMHPVPSRKFTRGKYV